MEVALLCAVWVVVGAMLFVVGKVGKTVLRMGWYEWEWREMLRESTLAEVPRSEVHPYVRSHRGMYPLSTIAGHVRTVIDAADSGQTLFLYRFVLGAPRVSLCTVSSVKHVLLHNEANYPKPETANRTLAEITGDSSILVVDNGPDHLRLRRIMHSAFRVKTLTSRATVFTRNASLVVQELRDLKPADSEWFVLQDVHEQMSLVALRVICDYVYGSKSLNVEILAAFRDVFLEDLTALVVLNIMFPMLSLVHPKLKRRKAALREIRSHTLEIIRERKSARAASGGEQRAGDMLDLLLDARDEEGLKDESARLSEVEMVDQALTMFSAGQVTTAIALAWSLYMLALSPQHQATLQTEVTELRRKHRPSFSQPDDHSANDEVYLEALDQLPFLNSVLSETLRLYNPVPVSSRIAKEPDVLDGHKIPAHTVVNIQLGALLRLRSLWGDDADAFDPSRWLRKSPVSDQAQLVAMLPFFLGSRTCLGRKFAVLEFKAVLAELVNSFEFRAVPGCEPVRVSFLGYPSGLHLQLRPRS